MAMEIEETKQQEGSSASLAGWPFGLTSCIAIHTPSRPSPAVALAFQQQFMNLQTTFLLPFFSDVGESSSSDSEAASSFFKDSRRITLGSLIGLPMDHSFHHPGVDHDVFAAAAATSNNSRPSFCVPVLELLRCVRNAESSSDELGFGFADQDDGEAQEASISTAYLNSSTGAVNGIIHSAAEVDAGSNGSHSPDWNQQFVSCHSVLSDESCVIPSPCRKQKRMQRSVSMKSFFSSICCRIDAVQSRP